MKQKRNISHVTCAVTTGYLAAMGSLYLLFPGLRGYSSITSEKFPLFWILTGGYILTALLIQAEGALIGESGLSLRAYLASTTWPERFCLIYLLLTWVSALASPWFPETISGVSRQEGALTITLYCLSFLLVARWGKASRTLLLIWAAGLALCCLLSLMQLAGANPLGLYPAGCNYYDGGIRYGGFYLGSIGNVDLLAGLLALGIPMLWVAVVRRKERWRFWLLLPLALCLAVLVWMDVLAGLVGVFGGALLTLPVVLPVQKKRRKWLWLLVAAVFLLILLLLFLVDLGGGLFHEIHLMLHGQASDSFGSGRLYIWRNVLSRVPGHLLLGTGPDTMLYAEIDAFTRYDAALGGTIVSQIDVAHNIYLNILYHQGILALLAYLGMLAAAAWQWLRRSSTDGVTALLGAGLLGYGIQGFFGIEMFLVSPFFWLTLALLVGRSRRDTNICKRIKRREQKCGRNC
ncbi:MAG TPA: O-antigen ligase family protein [Candidatus Avoscillospira avicola]|uniref:O-antigen ligase family protein n=1 Tax=Candidatus Avoscillospira avicola TaxID=2840706 RepID=A0A9D1DGT3_9FIRM|nr:O-antigen ligase family protein [Candidatus Avoscillospira avicola]